MIERISAILLCFTAMASAGDFIAYKTTSLTGSAETVTVQQPATGAKSLRFSEGYAYCSVACTITLSLGGTAATTTSFTPVSLAQPAETAKATAFHTSNVGAGTTVATYTLAAGGSISLDLSNMGMIGSNTSRNLTPKTDSITGNAHVGISWREH